jgi:hypothetical protein
MPAAGAARRALGRRVVRFALLAVRAAVRLRAGLFARLAAARRGARLVRLRAVRAFAAVRPRLLRPFAVLRAAPRFRVDLARLDVDRLREDFELLPLERFAIDTPFCAPLKFDQVCKN